MVLLIICFQFCGKLFAAGNKMRRHVAEVHEGRKNHMCNTCGKCFARLDITTICYNYTCNKISINTELEIK
jgi:hypothetical protein